MENINKKNVSITAIVKIFKNSKSLDSQYLVRNIYF